MEQLEQNKALLGELSTFNGEGRIGLACCPGKPGKQGLDRDLAEDVQCLKDWGAAAVISLMEPEEMADYGVSHLGEAIARSGMRWFHLPIEDDRVPDAKFQAQWECWSWAVHQLLDEGARVVVHCRGGTGRTGLFAAQLLIERGCPLPYAIELVREQRPKALQNPAHLPYLELVAAAN